MLGCPLLLGPDGNATKKFWTELKSLGKEIKLPVGMIPVDGKTESVFDPEGMVNRMKFTQIFIPFLARA